MTSEGLTATRSLDGPVPGVPGAVVREVNELPEHLPGGVQIGPRTEAAPGALLFEVPGIARYLIRDGNTIEVAVAASADRDAAGLIVQTAARGSLVHQRGELALTATTLIAPNWKCVAVCAPSAIGKSALAAELCRRGWLLVSDDITRVSWNGSMAIAWPNSNRLKLWRDTCEGSGVDTATLARVREGVERYYLPVAATDTPAALAVVVAMRVGPRARVMSLPQMDCGPVLAESTFRPLQIDPLGRRAEYENTVLRASQFCRAVRLDGALMSPAGQLADRLAEAIR